MAHGMNKNFPIPAHRTFENKRYRLVFSGLKTGAQNEAERWRARDYNARVFEKYKGMFDVYVRKKER